MGSSGPQGSGFIIYSNTFSLKWGGKKQVSFYYFMDNELDICFGVCVAILISTEFY